MGGGSNQRREMQKTPLKCLEEWEGVELEVQSDGVKGCCLVIKKNIIGSGVSKRDPQSKPLVKMPEQREILVALVHKAGGSLRI